MKTDVQQLAVQLSSVPAAMEALDRLQLEIVNAPRLEVLIALADVAAGLQRRWKPVRQVADRAGECWIEAIDKLGAEKAKLGTATGTRGNFIGKASGSGTGRGKARAVVSGGTKSVPPETAPSARELGLSKRLATLGRKVHELGPTARKKLEAELKADAKPVTPNAVLALARQQTKNEKKRQIAAAVFSSTGPFDCVVIDPPWPMQKIDREERPNQDAFDYPVMTEEQLAEFWPEKIATKLSADVHVFCWTTQKFLPMTLRLIERWGLHYVLAMVWHKSGGFQPIGLPQYNCEFIVYARKGAPVFIDTKDFDCCFEAPRREHSRKPDKFYDVIRRVTGGSRIDVFSRELREGFAQFGNELQKFAEAV